MKRIAKYYKPFLAAILGIVALLLVQALTDLALPNYMSRIIDSGIAAGNVPYILTEGAKMIAMAVISTLSAIVVGYIACRVAAKISMRIRKDVFERVSRFSSFEFNAFSTASLITRSTNDVQQIQMFTAILLRMVLLAPMMGVGALIMAYRKSPGLSWTVFLGVVLLLGLILVLMLTAMPKFKIIQSMVDRLNLVINERLTGMMVIRAFNSQSLEENRFDDANRDLTKLNLFVNRTMAVMPATMMLIMNGISILIVWVGAGFIDQGSLQIGDMMAFIQYTMQVIMSFLMVSMIFIMLPRALVSINRIAEVLNTKPTVLDPEQPANFVPEKKGVVEFDHVYFRYPDATEDVLTDISFTARPGETTAFIGSTGSGKTTIVNLIPRFFDVTAGSIKLNGVDIRDITQHDLRERIGYVSQKAVLFSGSIRSNLEYGVHSAEEQSLLRAAATAQALDFIESKEEGFDAAITQGGTNVSGGQKQRLSIGRALVKNADVLIFDDSFSALDFTTDKALRKSLSEQYKDKTMLIVAQRINTIQDADKIIVLDDGKIAGTGTHKELLQNCPVYKEIALSQLREEELA